jgi:tetratricopeptide (TPR) repeat protein
MNGGSPADVGGSTERVKELKKMGNRAMRCLNFDEAVKLYTEAILLCGSAGMGPDTRGGDCLEVLYANRSSAYHSSGRYEEALADAENCILLENSSLGHQAKAAALDGLGRLREATQSKLIASLLLREDGAHEASGRCDSGSGISTSPSVFDAGGAGGGAECVGAVYARGEGRELANAGEVAVRDLDLEWSGWQQELNTDSQGGAAAGQRRGQFGKKRNAVQNSLSTLAAVAVSQHSENGGSENEILSAVHQPLPPPPPGKLTNWDNWRKKTALFALKEMIVDPCSNHLLIDTRSKADFDRSHAWTAVEVRAFFIPVKFLTQKSICAEDKRSSVIRKASHHWLLV